ncbi:leucine-rich repeat-containing protein 23 [Plakobranchus ocellatus]|uniref:Leucine-rich repeat-containing protein 23 n=1 Tax=Plakobranchus ocellatus TaxID=259542 RepID=A0AAV4B5F3_9GAST|nr:leucine-rich repeat-containing protein 23 [Plakobranchus ocellatus]
MSEEEEIVSGEGEEEETRQVGEDDGEDDDEDLLNGDEEEHVEAEEEEKIPPNPLTEDLVAESLSLLCKTGDGLAHAYVRLDVHERDITDIEILQNFIHLRYVDISKNSLKDITPLSALTHMLTLKADENLLTTAKLDEMPFLQVASFSHNRIVTTEGINHPLLEHLNLNNNKIKEVTGLDPTKLTRLHTLELRGNKLESTDGIYLSCIKNLFLAANVIRRIEGMSRLTGLTTLHLRDNQLENLEGFSDCQKALQYLNLRNNLVTSVKESSKIKVLPMLRALVLSGNPCAEQDDYRLETLIGIRTLERLDKDEYTDEERTEAEEIAEQRRIEEEERANEAEADAEGEGGTVSDAEDRASTQPEA